MERFLLAVIFAATACGESTSADEPDAAPFTPGAGDAPSLPPPTDVEPIVANNVFAVYSVLKDGTGGEVETSNIIVIKGNTTNGKTEVIVYGMGYGDPNGDVNDYLARVGMNRDSMHDSFTDATNVDAVITDASWGFGLTRSNVKLRLVIPHYHLDHVNQEFVSSLLGLGYSTSATKVYVHFNDYREATCGVSPHDAACCGSSPCTSFNDPNFGAPFALEWTSATLGLFARVGKDGTDCTDLSSPRFSTPSGTWILSKDKQVSRGGHTDGTMNLRNEGGLALLYVWDRDSACAPPAGSYTRWETHDRSPF